MKKTFIAPKAQMVAMQTESLMQASGNTVNLGTGARPGTAQAKLGTSEFQWN